MVDKDELEDSDWKVRKGTSKINGKNKKDCGKKKNSILELANKKDEQY